ncbi:MAG: ABC transporter ATP-binding protein/permease [Christensenellaceae bacterium]|jgi:ATP-binding cassette subfamily C protein|nr:ABC transporter ATP-binding protein/permease [Christensenellaceae bacterium]
MLSYLLKDKFKILGVISLNMIHTLLVTGLALVYGNLVNIVADGATAVELLKALGFALIYSLVAGFSEWVRHIASNKYYNRLLVRMQNDMYSRLIASKYDFITKDDSSKHYDYMTSDLYRVRGAFSSLIVLTDRIVAAVSSFIAAAILNYKVALVMISMVVFMALIPVITKNRLIKAELSVSDRSKLWARSVKENLMGVSIIKSFAAEDRSISEIANAGNILRKTHDKKTILDAAINGAATIIQNISMLGLVGLTCYFVVTKEVAVGAVLSIVQIGMSFYGGILGLAANIAFYWGTYGIRKRVWNIIGKGKPSKYTGSYDFVDAIEFKNLSFCYNEDVRPILDNITAKFEKNKKYLILGRSGSGKSTLLKLIANFYDTYTGDLLIDNINYTDAGDGLITSVVAIAQQNCYLFNRSMRYNIDYLQTGDEERLNQIINFTCLDDFIARLPNGIDTVVDEEVNQVSGGEKLRINLARALFRDGSVLLLDEVTSSLDKATASRVESNLLTLNNKTILNVCHKFNDQTLPLYDMILIVENGHIVEQGNYASLQNSPKLNEYRNTIIDENTQESIQ